MALKPTIYKFSISLSDMNRHLYQTLNLTVAQHPSENIERMMIRVLVYCLNIEADQNTKLEFTKGLSAVDEPDLWAKTLDDQLMLWIDLGEPSLERIKKASRLARVAKVYTFNSKSDVWWSQNQAKLQALKVDIIQFDWSEVQNLAKLAQRNMAFSISLSGDSAYIAAELGDCELHWSRLQEQNT